MPAHEPDRPGGWISLDLARAYPRLRDRGRVTFRNLDGVEVPISKEIDGLLAHPTFLRLVNADRRSEPYSHGGGPVTGDEDLAVRRLLAICEAADDQDTGSLDAFREAATVGMVAALCRAFLASV